MAASALASGMLMLGQQFVGSAEPDAAVQADNQGDLVSQALAQGVIDQSDLAFAPAAVSAVPTVTAVSPNAGPLKGGQIVSITGTGFLSASAVNFSTSGGDTAATNYAIVNDTKIVATVPDAAAGGVKNVKVTNTDGTNATGPAYTYGAPTVTGVTPVFADPGTSKYITITGTGFSGALLADVKIGTWAPKAIWVVSDTQIIAQTPTDDSGASPAIDVTEGVTDVKVTRNSVESATSAATKFLFSPGVPTVTLLGATGAEVTGTEATTGVAVGGTLTVTGTRLWGVSKVNFGSTAVTAAADISVDPAGTSLTVKVPARSTSGPVDVTVENVIGVSSTGLKTRFNYIGTVAPTITSVTPNVLNKAASGGGGTFLVTGTGFSGATTSKVTLKCTADVTPTSVVVVSDTNLIVTVGGNAGTAESCGLEIVNAADSTKKVTSANAVKYV